MRLLGFIAITSITLLFQGCTTSGSMSVGSQYNLSSVHRHSVTGESEHEASFTSRSSATSRQNTSFSITGP